MNEHEKRSPDPAAASVKAIAEAIEAAIAVPAGIEEEMMLEAAELVEVEVIEVETSGFVDVEIIEQ